MFFRPLVTLSPFFLFPPFCFLWLLFPCHSHSAGIGRTGTMIVIDIIFDLIEQYGMLFCRRLLSNTSIAARLATLRCQPELAIHHSLGFFVLVLLTVWLLSPKFFPVSSLTFTGLDCNIDIQQTIVKTRAQRSGMIQTAVCGFFWGEGLRNEVSALD